jgi:lipopolysaccharide biosynthesis regulator YciM
MTDLVLYLLLVLALAASWYSGYSSKASQKRSARLNSEQDYFIGLNYLLNDEPEQSVDSFIASLEINSTTLESHLALGTLLRRRGKVDSSIAVFQKLLAESQLDDADLDKVKLGLTKSYVAAGLLDRAERLIDELKVADVEIRYAALLQGIVVYQLEKEWLKAIMMVNELLKVCPANQRQTFQLKASHYYCELAEKEMGLQHYNQAREYLHSASGMSKNNARASLLLGKLELAQGHYSKAIKVLQKISTQDSDFKVEAFDLLVSAYQSLGQEAELKRYIEHCLQDSPSPGLILKVVQHVEAAENKQQARDLLLQQLQNKPAIELLGDAILLDAGADKLNNASLFKATLNNYLNAKARYQCKNCGFELQKLHWLCPGCNEWGYVKPIELQNEQAAAL